MSFAPNKINFEAYETFRKERPKSATILKDVYGSKSIQNTPSSAEAAYLIMKQIHQVTGEILPDKGRSLFENLQYIKTEPSVKVLKKTPWRQYFQEIGSPENLIEEKEKELSPKKYHDKNDQYNNQQSKLQNQSQVIKKNEINYQRLFEQLVRRVQGLWRELHIPDSDRDFYSYSLLQGPYRNPSQIDELTIYTKLLKQHRVATINVLSAISERESCIIHCTEIIASARRVNSLKYLSIQDGINHKIDEINDRNNEIAKEIQSSIKSIQKSSLKVSEAIKIWRQDLWRPHAFVYQGNNYLIKMASDMDLLKTDSIKRLFDTLEITSTIDLNGVIFSTDIETGSSIISQQLSVRDLTSDEENIVDSTSTPHLIQSNHIVLNDKSTIEQNSEILSELEFLNTLIKDEPTLQRALILEKRALMTRGTFIPLLKFEIKESK